MQAVLCLHKYTVHIHMRTRTRTHQRTMCDTTWNYRGALERGTLVSSSLCFCCAEVELYWNGRWLFPSHFSNSISCVCVLSALCMCTCAHVCVRLSVGVRFVCMRDARLQHVVCFINSFDLFVPITQQQNNLSGQQSFLSAFNRHRLKFTMNWNCCIFGESSGGVFRNKRWLHLQCFELVAKVDARAQWSRFATATLWAISRFKWKVH